MKKTILVLVVVLLFQEIVAPGELACELLVDPASIASIAAALRFIPFDH